jgi:hypothetical protein
MSESEFDDDVQAFGDALRAGVEAVVQYAQAAEQIVALLSLSKYLVERIAELEKRDNALAPELVTAGKNIAEAVAALARAFDFAQARMQVGIEGK